MHVGIRGDIGFMILKHRDRELLRFKWLEPQGVRVVSVNEANRRFLPLEMKGNVSDETLWSWLRHRTIPRNRAYVQNFLANFGLRVDDVQGIVRFCRALSLNDVHWVVDDCDTATWGEVNLYTNSFSDALAFVAFTGAAEHVPIDSSSPEFTTNGMLAKCWRRKKGVTLLFKSGTQGAANSGNEPYSEFYAAQIADALGLSHVAYGLAMFKGRLCSTCPLFTSERYGYLPAGRVMTREEALVDSRFSDIFFFDALICNTDRHLGNFGYLVDNEKNEIVGPAPIFDNGYGLFPQGLYEHKHGNDFADLSRYAASLSPALYSSWLAIPGGVTERMKELLQRLQGFRFKRHENYNLPTGRLRAIEDFLQTRITQICSNAVTVSRICESHEGRVSVKSKSRKTDVTERQLSQEMILNHLKADPFLTISELAALFGVHRRTIQRKITSLKDAGRLQRIGSDKSGSWKVVCSSLR